MQAKQKVSDIAAVILKSFIGITVVIPVISGIALSSGLKIFSNRSSYKRALREEETARTVCFEHDG
jgi:hypothetical protein